MPASSSQSSSPNSWQTRAYMPRHAHLTSTNLMEWRNAQSVVSWNLHGRISLPVVLHRHSGPMPSHILSTYSTAPRGLHTV
eukprot:4301675-Pleurochrysis_carterae.AAC.1